MGKIREKLLEEEPAAYAEQLLESSKKQVEVEKGRGRRTYEGLIAISVALGGAVVSLLGAVQELTAAKPLFVVSLAAALAGSVSMAFRYLQGSSSADRALDDLRRRTEAALDEARWAAFHRAVDAQDASREMTGELRPTPVPDEPEPPAPPPTPTELAGEHVRSYFTAGSGRLSAEVASLVRRGNINLLIGGATTLVAAGILIWLAFETRGYRPSSIADLCAVYLPRLGLGVTIQVVAFFFLRLYRAGLADVKFFQNELTNLEARYAAVRVALLVGGTEVIAAAIASLSSTERNTVLRTGESTIELERERAENEVLREVVRTFGGAVSSKKKE
jgi:hypothetical protein